MTIIAARNGLVATLSACGPWTAAEISTCDFGIMERVSACAIIITPTGESNIEPLTIGGKAVAFNDLPTWDLTGEVYVRFTGDSPAFLSKIWQAIDDVHKTVKKDRTLGGNVSHAWVTKFIYNVNEGYDMAGKDYGVVRFKVEVTEL
jgi:hypothetical protein